MTLYCSLKILLNTEVKSLSRIAIIIQILINYLILLMIINKKNVILRRKKINVSLKLLLLFLEIEIYHNINDILRNLSFIVQEIFLQKKNIQP